MLRRCVRHNDMQDKGKLPTILVRGCLREQLPQQGSKHDVKLLPNIHTKIPETMRMTEHENVENTHVKPSL